MECHQGMEVGNSEFHSSGQEQEQDIDDLEDWELDG